MAIGVFSKDFSKKVVRATKIVLGERKDKRFTQTRQREIYFPILVGHTNAAHAADATGTINIYRGSAGNETDSGDTVTAYNPYADLEADVRVYIVYLNGGWQIISAYPCT